MPLFSALWMSHSMVNHFFISFYHFNLSYIIRRKLPFPLKGTILSPILSTHVSRRGLTEWFNSTATSWSYIHSTSSLNTFFLEYYYFFFLNIIVSNSRITCFHNLLFGLQSLFLIIFKEWELISGKEKKKEVKLIDVF